MAVLIATMLGFGVSILYSQHVLSKVDDAALSIATNASLSIKHLAAARAQLLRIQLAAASAVQRSTEGAPLDRTPFDNSLSRLHRELSEYLTLPFYPHEREHYAEVDQATRSLEARVSAFLAYLVARDNDSAVTALETRLSPVVLRADAAIQYLVTFNAEQQHQLAMGIPKLRIHAARVGYVLEGVIAFFGLILMVLVMRAIREQERLTEKHARDVATFSSKLESLIASSVRISETITTADDLHKIFQAIADEARSVLNARYCALGSGTDPERPFDPWVFSGMEAAEAEALGRPPRPVGLLGAVIQEGHLIRLAELTDHPAFRGLPAHHPKMGPFLGVPVLHDGRNVGNLYLGTKGR